MEIHIHIDDRVVAFFKRAFSRRALIIVTCLLVAGMGTALHADVLNVFSPGETISSSQVNANFAQVDGRIGDLEGRSRGIWRFTKVTAVDVSSSGPGFVPIDSTALDPGSWLVTATFDVHLGSNVFGTCKLVGSDSASYYDFADLAAGDLGAAGTYVRVTLQGGVSSPEQAVTVGLQCDNPLAPSGVFTVSHVTFTALQVTTLTKTSP